MSRRPRTPGRPRGDRTERLATLNRRGPQGVARELRVALDRYEDRQFVSLQVWELGRGGMLPDAPAIALRPWELPQVIRALQIANRRLNPGQGQRPAGYMHDQECDELHWFGV